MFVRLLLISFQPEHLENIISFSKLEREIPPFNFQKNFVPIILVYSGFPTIFKFQSEWICSLKKIIYIYIFYIMWKLAETRISIKNLTTSKSDIIRNINLLFCFKMKWKQLLFIFLGPKKKKKTHIKSYPNNTQKQTNLRQLKREKSDKASQGKRQGSICIQEELMQD